MSDDHRPLNTRCKHTSINRPNMPLKRPLIVARYNGYLHLVGSTNDPTKLIHRYTLWGFTKFHSSQEDDGNTSFIHDRCEKIHVTYKKYDTNEFDSRSVWHPSSCDLERAISVNDSDFSCAIISGNHMTPPHVTLFTVDLHSREHVWCSSAWHDRPRGHESDERCGLTIDDGPWLYDAVAR